MTEEEEELISEVEERLLDPGLHVGDRVMYVSPSINLHRQIGTIREIWPGSQLANVLFDNIPPGTAVCGKHNLRRM